MFKGKTFCLLCAVWAPIAQVGSYVIAGHVIIETVYILRNVQWTESLNQPLWITWNCASQRFNYKSSINSRSSEENCQTSSMVSYTDSATGCFRSHSALTLTSMKLFDLCINKCNSTATHGCFLKHGWQMKNLTSKSYRKSICMYNGARCFVTWNRYSVKRICAIDSLFVTLVDTSYWQSDMCKFESSQKHESRDQSADSFKGCSKTRTLVVSF